MTPLDSLLLELIPTRLTPAPKATTGPTEQWAMAERQRELWRVAAESVSDADESVTGGKIETAPRGLHPYSTPNRSPLRTQEAG